MNENLLEKILVSALQLSVSEREVLASRLRVAVERAPLGQNLGSSPLPEKMESPQSLLSPPADGGSASGGE